MFVRPVSGSLVWGRLSVPLLKRSNSGWCWRVNWGREDDGAQIIKSISSPGSSETVQSLLVIIRQELGNGEMRRNAAGREHKI